LQENKSASLSQISFINMLKKLNLHLGQIRGFSLTTISKTSWFKKKPRLAYILGMEWLAKCEKNPWYSDICSTATI